MRVNVAGDEPVSIYRFLKVPEDWQRTRQESTTLKTALSGLLIVLIAAVVIHGLWLLVRRVRNEGIVWSPLIKIAAIGAAFFSLHLINGLSVVERLYNTHLTLSIFTITQILGIVLGGLGIGLVLLAALGLASLASIQTGRRACEPRGACPNSATLSSGSRWSSWPARRGSTCAAT